MIHFPPYSVMFRVSDMNSATTWVHTRWIHVEHCIKATRFSSLIYVEVKIRWAQKIVIAWLMTKVIKFKSLRQRKGWVRWIKFSIWGACQTPPALLPVGFAQYVRDTPPSLLCFTYTAKKWAMPERGHVERCWLKGRSFLFLRECWHARLCDSDLPLSSPAEL